MAETNNEVGARKVEEKEKGSPKKEEGGTREIPDSAGRGDASSLQKEEGDWRKMSANVEGKKREGFVEGGACLSCPLQRSFSSLFNVFREKMEKEKPKEKAKSFGQGKGPLLGGGGEGGEFWLGGNKFASQGGGEKWWTKRD